MSYLAKDDPKAVRLSTAIKEGKLDDLRELIHEEPQLVHVKIGIPDEDARTLLHIATDWPGNCPNVAQTIQILVEAGANLNAPYEGPSHKETPLHWAASNDDVVTLDALLDAGADIEAPGSLFYNGTAIADAAIFAQWKAAERLIKRGAKTNLTESAALGLLDRVKEFVEGGSAVSEDEINNAMWMASHGGQRAVAEYLLGKGADKN